MRHTTQTVPMTHISTSDAINEYHPTALITIETEAEAALETDTDRVLTVVEVVHALLLLTENWIIDTLLSHFVVVDGFLLLPIEGLRNAIVIHPCIAEATTLVQKCSAPSAMVGATRQETTALQDDDLLKLLYLSWTHTVLTSC
jgi:hypothetical protein